MRRNRTMTEQLILNHRFAVSFLGWARDGLALETRFQTVSGPSLTVATTDVIEGGQNLHTWSLPERSSAGKLTLTRGMVVGSFVDLDLTLALSPPQFVTTDVLVRLLGEDQKPVAAWYYDRAYPTQWSTGALNAESPGVVIDTVELTYTRVRAMRI